MLVGPNCLLANRFRTGSLVSADRITLSSHVVIVQAASRQVCCVFDVLAWWMLKNDPQILTVGGPNIPQTNPRWRTAAILKNRKILISSQPIDRFWQNLAWRCVSTIWTLITNKILRFKKSKMEAAAILKIRKISISSVWRCVSTLWILIINKFRDFENSRWRWRPS